MQITPIRTDADLDRAVRRIDVIWGAPDGTPEGDELEVLCVLVEAYEAQHHAVPPGDPIALLRFKMRELALSQNALAKRLSWTSGRVSEVLSGKRELTIRMVRELAAVLGLPAGALLGETGRPAVAERTPLDLPADVVADVLACAERLDLTPADWLRQVAGGEGSRASAVQAMIRQRPTRADDTVRTIGCGGSVKSAA